MSAATTQPPTTPIVGNLRHHTPIGPGVVRIDRATRWGNPFRLARGAGPDERARCITRHRHWLLTRCVNGEVTHTDMCTLSAAQMFLCWCAPQPCHGDTLRECALKAAALAPDAWIAWCQSELNAMDRA